MIIVEVMGGLGNQMFQYAYARSIQQIYKEDLYIDTNIYKKYKIRNYSLSNLILNAETKDISEAKLSKFDYLKINISRKYYRIYQKLIRTIKGNDELGENLFKKYSKKGMLYNFDRYYYPTIELNNKIKVVYGYYQSEKYFDNIKDILKKELKVKVEPTNTEKVILEDILNCNSVAVSIRWGEDYKNSGLDVCDQDYFYKAMDYIADKVENPVFFIFSDKIDLIKKDFKFKYKVKYIENMNDYQSLRLMYSCKQFVISNSSFSWWGAYLSENKQKIVISPDKWYKQCCKTPDIYSDFMTIIKK